jgi:hypothetical protein
MARFLRRDRGAQPTVVVASRLPRASVRTSGPKVFVQDSNISEKCPSQSVHLVVRQAAGIPPLNGRSFIAVGGRCSADDRGIEDCDHVGRLIPIGIGLPVFRATQHRQKRSKLQLDPGLLCGFPEGSLLRRLIGFNRSADGCPKSGVDESHEEQPAPVIPRKYGYRREYEKFVPNEVSEPSYEGRDRH